MHTYVHTDKYVPYIRITMSAHLEEMVGQILGDEVIEALRGGLNQGAHQVIKAPFVLNEVRRIEVVSKEYCAERPVPPN